MPIKGLRRNKIESPADAQIRQRSFGENLAIGGLQGLRETSISMLTNLNAKATAQIHGTDYIPEDQWNESHPYYTPGVAWEPYLTLDYAAGIKENYDFRREAEDTMNKSSSLGAAGQMIGMFGGAILDPVNLLPLGTAKAGYTFLKNAARVGAGNAAIEVGLVPLYRKGYEARGEEYTANDAMLNIGLAFGAGVGLYGAGRGVKALFDRMSGGNIGNYPGKSAVDEHISKHKETDENFEVSDQVKGLIDGFQISLASRAVDNTNIANRNFDDIPETIYVDTYGDTSSKPFEQSISISNDAGTVVVKGSRNQILKLAKTLDEKISDDKQIRFEFDDGNEQTFFRPNLKKWIADTEKATGIKSKLDTTMVERTIEGEVIQFKLNDAGEISQAFRVKNGKTTKLSAKETEKLKKYTIDAEVPEPNKTVKSSSQINAEQPRDIINGNETIKEQSQRTLQSHKNLNDVDASTSGRGTEYNKNKGDSSNFIKAIITGRGITMGRLKRIGMAFDQDTMVLRTVDKKGNALKVSKDLSGNEKEMREILLKQLEKQNRGATELQAKEDLFACIPRI